jgi:hypothetical protein
LTERIADGDAAEIGNPQPLDSDLSVAGDHCFALRPRKTVNH